MSLTKSELIAAIATQTGNTKVETERFLEALRDVAKIELVEKKAKLALPGLVALTPVLSAARVGRNPKTGEVLDIPARYKVKALLEKGLRDKMI